MPKKKKAAAKAAAAAEAGGIKPAAATRSKGNKRSRVIESDIEDERNNEVQSQQGPIAAPEDFSPEDLELHAPPAPKNMMHLPRPPPPFKGKPVAAEESLHDAPLDPVAAQVANEELPPIPPPHPAMPAAQAKPAAAAAEPAPVEQPPPASPALKNAAAAAAPNQGGLQQNPLLKPPPFRFGHSYTAELKSRKTAAIKNLSLEGAITRKWEELVRSNIDGVRPAKANEALLPILRVQLNDEEAKKVIATFLNGQYMVQLRARIAFFRALNYLCAPTDNPHWLDEQKINFLWAKIYPPITQFSTPTDQEIERLRQWWFQWRDSTQEEMVRKLCQDEAE